MNSPVLQKRATSSLYENVFEQQVRKSLCNSWRFLFLCMITYFYCVFSKSTTRQVILFVQLRPSRKRWRPEAYESLWRRYIPLAWQAPTSSWNTARSFWFLATTGWETRTNETWGTNHNTNDRSTTVRRRLKRRITDVPRSTEKNAWLKLSRNTLRHRSDSSVRMC